MNRFALNIVLGAMLLVSPVSCLVSWWTEVSPHVAMQDPATGHILYSLCNSNHTPIFPTDGKNALNLLKRARNGTALAGAGWYDAKKLKTVASLFFINEDGSIVNGYFECDMNTGFYATKGEYVISSTAGVQSIHPQTGLTVELLGAENGYRVFFHDEKKRVNVLSYTTKTDWQLQGQISQEVVPTMALSSVHSGVANVSVIFPKDSETLEISRYYKDDSWRIATLPRPLANNTVTNNTDAANILLDSSMTPNFTLPAWPRNVTSFAASVDHSYVRSIFYIGTDAKLHQVSNINWAWTMMPGQAERLWPVADEPAGALTSTNNFDTNEIWLWYRSNGSLVQVYHNPQGLWVDATTVPSFNTTPPADGGSASPTETSGATAKPAVLSMEAKAGIGVGVTVGVLAIAGIGIFFFVRRRRQQIEAEEARLKEIEAVTRQTSFGNSIYGAGGVGPYSEYGNLVWSPEGPREKLGTPILEADTRDIMPPQELPVGERHELVGEGHFREMDATGQNAARRSIGGWREAQADRQ
ncbi:uncharacterized protein CTRU02_207476 [Colletotrichum truncatum]|uniref:Uncharacterized protein n=1 Tax=Colletotrichum truncatum TaxID=5467 RepID=A0ACC3Z0X7_COLTU|nr:uncharacterized protein CTRU02_00888 [Colletotrichum truncatum]KAF6800483.1 hypothetical protein CTRU02_00888 [Colletotrichum truncatum]